MDTLIDVLKVIANISIIATAIFVFFQMRSTASLVKDMLGLTERKRERAFEFINKWGLLTNQDKREEAIKLLKDMHRSPKDKFTALNDDMILKNALLAELYFLEQVALAIERSTVEEPVLKSFFTLIVIQRYKDVREFVEFQRKELIMPEFLKGFTNLAHKWGAS